MIRTNDRGKLNLDHLDLGDARPKQQSKSDSPLLSLLRVVQWMVQREQEQSKSEDT